MSTVFVVDTKKHPLAPVHPGQARVLLKQGKAAVWKRYPFTLILKQAVERPHAEPLRLKIDPGSKVTGLAIVDAASGQVVFAAELAHRGQKIKEALDTRRAVRRGRRQRKTRYRAPRWRNRRRRPRWLPPSLESRIHNVVTWVHRLRRVCPIGAISLELVKFDMQAMEKPEIQAHNTSRALWQDMRPESTCLRSGTAAAPIVGKQACRSRSSTLCPAPKEEVTV